MIVVDASAILEVLLRTPAAGVIEDRILADGETLHAPHLLDLEVAQVLRRYVIVGTMSPYRGTDALDDLRDFRMTRYSHTIFLPRIWELRSNMTAYDAAYVALAESLGATLLTRDRRLSKSPGHDAAIEVI
ncbi:MAG: type II toxin-antitoxin system VapC family toxin [Rhodothermia bacterium]